MDGSYRYFSIQHEFYRQSLTHQEPPMSATIGRILGLKPRHLRLCGFRNFYDWRTRSDSIYALATSVDTKRGSPLGVIRVSGPNTASILQSIIRRKPVRSVEQPQSNAKKNIILPRHATLSKLLDPKSNSLIDVGLVLWFPQPNSYTGEDSCEFHVHGSQAIIKRLLSTLGSFDNMRPAEPGEFTRRAVENGKLDLMQAESLSDLISSQTDKQRDLALRGLTGSTRARYEGWIDRLMKILAHLEASIDFGEDELIGEQRVVKECARDLLTLSKEISAFLSVTGRCMDLLEFGAKVVILGRPNAGKSTFMNVLCRQEKAIVSGMSGTTRDLIEHSFELNGHKLTLCDTAGLKDLNLSLKNRPGIETSQDHEDIEREGIKRAVDAAKRADLIIYMVDANLISETSTSVIVHELLEALNKIQACKKNKSIHLVINKIDLKEDVLELDTNEIISAIKAMQHEPANVCVTMISCKAQINIDKMIENITSSLDRLHLGDDESARQVMEYVNERHLSLLQSTFKHLDKAKDLNIYRIDEMAQHVRESVDYLSRIVGRVTNEQILDIIFRDFCIGK